MSDVLGIMGPFQALLFRPGVLIFVGLFPAAHMLDLPTLLYAIKRRTPTLPEGRTTK